MIYLRVAAIVLIVSGFFGCATMPQLAGKDIQALHEELCFGQSSKWSEVRGSIWVKLDSKQGSAQFPANVLVNAEGATIEVTDLFGGVLGLLKSKEGQFSYQGQGATSPVIKDIIRKQNLFGLNPNEFSGMFFGRLPCYPSIVTGTIKAAEVVFQTASSETEHFEVKAWGNQNLVKVMDARGFHLESGDYEEPHGTPKSWTIRSRFGTCVLRWRERTLTPKKL